MRLPDAPREYDPQNEALFRRTVEQILARTPEPSEEGGTTSSGVPVIKYEGPEYSKTRMRVRSVRADHTTDSSEIIWRLNDGDWNVAAAQTPGPPVITEGTTGWDFEMPLKITDEGPTSLTVAVRRGSGSTAAYDGFTTFLIPRGGLRLEEQVVFRTTPPIDADAGIRGRLFVTEETE